MAMPRHQPNGRMMTMDGDDLARQQMCHVVQMVMAHVIAVHINQGEHTSLPSHHHVPM